MLVRRIDGLRFAFREIQQRHPFYIDAITILPDHLHMIMTLPQGDMSYSTRISLIKASFSRRIKPVEIISQSRKNKRERGIWQRRYWEHIITNAQDYEHHVNYIHYNPVKHGYVMKPSDWQYSSIHRYIKQGFLSDNWTSEDSFELKFGE